jgi:iron complex outermembrane receptor protein
MMGVESDTATENNAGRGRSCWQTSSRKALLLGTALCAAAISGFVSAPAAKAQDSGAAPADQGKLEEIVVTARQRSEKEVEVPISIQAFSAAQIAAAGITDLNSLQFQAGFTFQQAASTQAGGREFPTLVMRGLEPTYGGDQQGNSGSLFVDGIFISSGLASLDTSDVSRIEVLKGPQNVYFGRSTFGGAINFITANPSNTFGGTIDASGTMRGSSNVTASVEGPLIDGILDGRLILHDYNKTAEYHATDGGDLGAEESKSVTGTLYATPMDGLWLRFRGHYQQDDDSAADLGFIPGTEFGTVCSGGKATSPTGKPVPVTLSSPYFCGTIPSLAQTGGIVLDQNTAVPGPFATSLANNSFGSSGASDPVLAQVPHLSHSGLRRDILQVSGQAGYDLPYGFNLALNAGYNSMQSLDIWDLDRSANQVFINAQPIASNDLTLDAKVSSDQSERLRGLIGISYFHSHYQIDQDDDNFYGYQPLSFLYSGTSIQTANYENETDETRSVYGSIDFDIVDWLTVTAEGRYQHDLVQDTTYGGGAQYSKTFNNILPRAIIKFHPEEDWNFYASWSEGIQPASLQTGYINATPAQRAYLATVVPGVGDYSPLAKLYSWEVGAKQSLFEGRLQYGLALYDEKWYHQETTAAVFNPAGCAATPLTAGCPLGVSGAFLYLSNNADIKGIEFSAAGQITPEWSADVSADYKHAVWLDYYNSTLGPFAGGATHFNGNQLSRVPSWEGAVSTTYRDHLFGDWEWFARGQMTYTGSMYESEVNVGKTSSFERVDASFGVVRDTLTVEIYAKNLLNDQNWDFASRVPELATIGDLFSGYAKYMGVLVQAPDRRDVGIKVHYKFGEEAAAAPEAPPAPYVPPPVIAPAPTARSYMVFFDFNKSDLTPDALKIVDQAAANAGPAKVTEITVTGHTDTVGSDAYNMRLSRRRAESVAAELEAKGIPSAEIAIFAKGKKDLLIPTADGVKEPQNRRVQIVYAGGGVS